VRYRIRISAGRHRPHPADAWDAGNGTVRRSAWSKSLGHAARCCITSSRRRFTQISSTSQRRQHGCDKNSENAVKAVVTRSPEKAFSVSRIRSSSLHDPDRVRHKLRNFAARKQSAYSPCLCPHASGNAYYYCIHRCVHRALRSIFHFLIFATGSRIFPICENAAGQQAVWIKARGGRRVNR